MPGDAESTARTATKAYKPRGRFRLVMGFRVGGVASGKARQNRRLFGRWYSTACPTRVADAACRIRAGTFPGIPRARWELPTVRIGANNKPTAKARLFVLGEHVDVRDPLYLASESAPSSTWRALLDHLGAWTRSVWRSVEAGTPRSVPALGLATPVSNRAGSATPVSFTVRMRRPDRTYPRRCLCLLSRNQADGCCAQRRPMHWVPRDGTPLRAKSARFWSSHRATVTPAATSLLAEEPSARPSYSGAGAVSGWVVSAVGHPVEGARVEVVDGPNERVAEGHFSAGSSVVTGSGLSEPRCDSRLRRGVPGFISRSRRGSRHIRSGVYGCAGVPARPREVGAMEGQAPGRGVRICARAGIRFAVEWRLEGSHRLYASDCRDPHARSRPRRRPRHSVHHRGGGACRVDCRRRDQQ